jgi:hypothetical protein
MRMVAFGTPLAAARQLTTREARERVFLMARLPTVLDRVRVLAGALPPAGVTREMRVARYPEAEAVS